MIERPLFSHLCSTSIQLGTAGSLSEMPSSFVPSSSVSINLPFPTSPPIVPSFLSVGLLLSMKQQRHLRSKNSSCFICTSALQVQQQNTTVEQTIDVVNTSQDLKKKKKHEHEHENEHENDHVFGSVTLHAFVVSFIILKVTWQNKCIFSSVIQLITYAYTYLTISSYSMVVNIE